jgi:hypothetical protein
MNPCSIRAVSAHGAVTLVSRTTRLAPGEGSMAGSLALEHGRFWSLVIGATVAVAYWLYCPFRHY